MARQRSHIEKLLRQIEQLSEAEQCELLEQMLLQQRHETLGWNHLRQLRAELSRRSQRAIKRDADTAIRQVRRAISAASRS